jgi:hypothetical protein
MHKDGIKRFTFAEAFSTRTDLRISDFVSRLTTPELKRVQALDVNQSAVLRMGADTIAIDRTE